MTPISEVIFVLILMVSILRALQAACPPGWLTWHDSCYILLPQKMNGTNAKKACDRPGVSLVFPNSIEEQIFVWEEMSAWMRELGATSSDELQLWINCYRHDNENFLCSDNEGTSSFGNWDTNSNQPNEDCVRMVGSAEGKWADIYCHLNYFVTCEMSALAYGCRH